MYWAMSSRKKARSFIHVLAWPVQVVVADQIVEVCEALGGVEQVLLIEVVARGQAVGDDHDEGLLAREEHCVLEPSDRVRVEIPELVVRVDGEGARHGVAVLIAGGKIREVSAHPVGVDLEERLGERRLVGAVIGEIVGQGILDARLELVGVVGIRAAEVCDEIAPVGVSAEGILGLAKGGQGEAHVLGLGHAQGVEHHLLGSLEARAAVDVGVGGAFAARARGRGGLDLGDVGIGRVAEVPVQVAPPVERHGHLGVAGIPQRARVSALSGSDGRRAGSAVDRHQVVRDVLSAVGEGATGGRDHRLVEGRVPLHLAHGLGVVHQQDHVGRQRRAEQEGVVAVGIERRVGRGCGGRGLHRGGHQQRRRQHAYGSQSSESGSNHHCARSSAPRTSRERAAHGVQNARRSGGEVSPSAAIRGRVV
jgi:hypothetical protein